MENKLISMVDFVLEQLVLLKNGEINILQFRNRIERYANFLKQELNIGMFVTAKKANGFWVVLEEPTADYFFGAHGGVYPSKKERYDRELREYQEAKENVLFEGFEVARSVKAVIIVSNGIPVHFCSETSKIRFEKENYTIEDLLRRNNSLGYNLTLTQSAKQKLSL